MLMAEAASVAEKLSMIEAKGLTKKFGKLTVFEDLNINVNKGEVLVIIGPSGSGKSTFLRCLNHLEVPEAGTVTIEGQTLNLKNKKEYREIIEKTGMVFQGFNLFPHMTVIQNVMAAPITVKKENAAKVRERAEKLIAKVGLSDKLDAYPSKLSGGQKQRVAIARALATEPELLLADEPTGALDSKTGKEVIEMLKELNKEGNTIVLITHDNEIAHQAKRIITVKDGYIQSDELNCEYSKVI